MAIKYAVADGNWSATTTWNDGTLPTSSDDVYANSFDVTIDQNIEVNKISTEECPTTGISGGGFRDDTHTTITIIGDVISGTSSCVYRSTYSNTYIIGNVYGGSSENSRGFYGFSNFNNQYVRVYVIGNVYGGSAVGSNGIYLHNNGETRYNYAEITGNVYGGSAAYGIESSSTSRTKGLTNIKIIGNLTASTYSAVHSCYNCIVIGTLTGSATGDAIYCLNSADITGSLVNAGGRMAIGGSFTFLYFNPISYTVYDSDGVEHILYTSDILENQPDEADTRSGVVYGIGNKYTGTLIVPDKETVLKGVPVDDTVGEYALNDEVIEHILELQNPKKVLGSGIIAYQ